MEDMLAIGFVVSKFHTYINGRADVTIETDHQPLVRIMNKPLYQVPIVSRRLQMRLQGYEFKLVHKVGTDVPVADVLNRA